MSFFSNLLLSIPAQERTAPLETVCGPQKAGARRTKSCVQELISLSGYTSELAQLTSFVRKGLSARRKVPRLYLRLASTHVFSGIRPWRWPIYCSHCTFIFRSPLFLQSSSKSLHTPKRTSLYVCVDSYENTLFFVIPNVVYTNKCVTAHAQSHEIQWYQYVEPALTFSNSTFCLKSVLIVFV